VKLGKYLWQRKWFWITPVMIFLVLLALLILWLDASAVIPFNYAVH